MSFLRSLLLSRSFFFSLFFSSVRDCAFAFVCLIVRRIIEVLKRVINLFASTLFKRLLFFSFSCFPFSFPLFFGAKERKKKKKSQLLRMYLFTCSFICLFSGRLMIPRKYLRICDIVLAVCLFTRPYASTWLGERGIEMR